MNTTNANTADATRRTDLRTVETHYSALDVYDALGVPYSGFRPNSNYADSFTSETPTFYHRRARDLSQAREQRPSEGNGGGSSFSSGDDGLSASTSSSAAAGVRRSGFSGDESNEYARNDRTNGGEEHRTVTDGGEPSTFDVGESVVDRDATDPNTAVVVALPDAPAYDYTLDTLDGSPTVADLNPEYGASGPVATVAFADELDDALDVWRSADPEALAGLCDEESVRTYTYPVERLREVSDE